MNIHAAKINVSITFQMKRFRKTTIKWLTLSKLILRLENQLLDLSKMLLEIC